MKKLVYIFLVTGLFSCERVVDIELNSSDPQYVIEGEVMPFIGANVKITQTKNFDENNEFTGVSGAVVSIADGDGTPVTLTETSPGEYTTDRTHAMGGHTYTLRVTIGSKTYVASSTIPEPVYMEDLRIEERVVYGKSRKVSTVVYTDPEGRGNNYRFLEYKNGVQETTIFVRNDEHTDGKTVSIQLVSFASDSDDEDKQFKSGDTIRIRMQCIDEAVYKYFYSLDAGATGEGQSATPANPVTNIQGGALGYFSAHTEQERTIMIR